MNYTDTTTYDDVISLARTQADSLKKSLLRTIFLSNPNNIDKPYSIDRMSIKSIDSYTALDKSSGTSVLLHRQDQKGRYSGYLTSDQAEQVNAILDGVPTDCMLQEWSKRLSSIRNEEHGNMRRGLETLHTVQKNKQESSTKRLVQAVEDNKKSLNGEICNIQNHQKDRNVRRQLGAFLFGAARREREEIEGYEEDIKKKNLEIEGINDEGKIKLNKLSQIHEVELKNLSNIIMTETSDEWIANEKQQFEEAFKFVMISCKGFDGAKPDNSTNDSDADMSLERSISLSDESIQDKMKKKREHDLELKKSQDLNITSPLRELDKRFAVNPLLALALNTVNYISNTIAQEAKDLSLTKGHEQDRDFGRDRSRGFGMSR